MNGYDFGAGLAFYALTSLVVGAGLAFSNDFLRWPSLPPSKRGSSDLLTACIRFDAGHYLKNARDGYEYNPFERSTAAFFPAHPLLAYSLAGLTGLRIEVALLLVSNASLAATFVLLARYIRARDPAAPAVRTDWVLLAFGLWPTTYFFRTGYAESMFLACALFVLYGITRGWPVIWLALGAGLATATRPVGVAVSAALLWHVLARPGRLAARLRQACLLAPIACWGLLAYMAYQWVAFGNPLAFAQTQENWLFRVPDARADWGRKLWSLASLEPIRGVYQADSVRFWSQSDMDPEPIFNLFFCNPILFLLGVGLLAVGIWRRWLTGPEIVLGASLLAIPYMTRAYKMSMASHGRFAAVVIPNYLVLGRLLAAAPAPVAAVAVSLSAVLLAFWTALYAAGYAFF